MRRSTKFIIAAVLYFYLHDKNSFRIDHRCEASPPYEHPYQEISNAADQIMSDIPG